MTIPCYCPCCFVSFSSFCCRLPSMRATADHSGELGCRSGFSSRFNVHFFFVGSDRSARNHLAADRDTTSRAKKVQNPLSQGQSNRLVQLRLTTAPSSRAQPLPFPFRAVLVFSFLFLKTEHRSSTCSFIRSFVQPMDSNISDYDISHFLKILTFSSFDGF